MHYFLQKSQKKKLRKWNGKKDNWKTVEMENSLLKCLNLLKMQKNTILKQQFTLKL